MTRKTLPQCAAQSLKFIICLFFNLNLFLFLSQLERIGTIETSVAPSAQVPSAALEIIDLEKSRSSQLTVPQAQNVLNCIDPVDLVDERCFKLDGRD